MVFENLPSEQGLQTISAQHLLSLCNDMCACACRKRVYKAPKAEERLFVAPPPGSLGSLSYPEFGYVLRARQAAQRAQQAASRSQMTDGWAESADTLDEEHLHHAAHFGEAPSNYESAPQRRHVAVCYSSPCRLACAGLASAPACCNAGLMAMGSSCSAVCSLTGLCIEYI